MSMLLPSGLCHRSLFGQKIYKCKITLGTSKIHSVVSSHIKCFAFFLKIHVMVNAHARLWAFSKNVPSGKTAHQMFCVLSKNP